MKKLLSITLILTFVLCLMSGCNNKQADSESESNAESTTAPVSVDFSKSDDDMFSDRDTKTDYDSNNAVTIKLSGTTATASSDSVQISSSKIVITQEATYVISGEMTDGMLIVNAKDTDKVQLVFNGVKITSKTSAALYVLQADKVFLTLADGTSNSLSNGGSFTAIDDNNIDSALFSKQDLTINGAGSLTVTSPAGHGIVCKDDLAVTGGTYTINSASHGIDANDSIKIKDASLTIDSGKDAVHAENTDDASLGFIYISSGSIKAEAEGDGIAASAYIQIMGGTIDLLVGGGAENGTKASSGNYGGFMGGGSGGGMRPEENQTTTAEDSISMKGIKSVNSLLISGGTFTINSADDSIHSDASVTINAGTFNIASGDDAVHAEDTLTVVSGKIDISQSYEGLEALHINIRGGDIKLKASDDGLNAAGGTDQSGFNGGRDGMFGGGPGGKDGPGGKGDPGGMGAPGAMSSNSNGSIKISGGKLYINSSGDGLDANGTLEISGGYTVVVGPTQGDTATLDYDTSGTITGGTFIGTGASGMAQSFSSSAQGVIAISIGNQSAGTKIVLKDKNGNTVIEHTPELGFAVVILSSPDIKKSESYTVTVGSQSGTFTAQ